MQTHQLYVIQYTENAGRKSIWDKSKMKHYRNTWKTSQSSWCLNRSDAESPSIMCVLSHGCFPLHCNVILQLHRLNPHFVSWSRTIAGGKQLSKSMKPCCTRTQTPSNRIQSNHIMEQSDGGAAEHFYHVNNCSGRDKKRRGEKKHLGFKSDEDQNRRWNTGIVSQKGDGENSKRWRQTELFQLDWRNGSRRGRRWITEKGKQPREKAEEVKKQIEE